jgi:prophage DNA circulation protein
MATVPKKRLPASFRGVPFEVAAHEHGFGHKHQIHEFPGGTRPPFAEPIGTKAEDFTVEAFILDNGAGDLETRRDKLRRAMKTPGPGTLVHPYLGTMKVVPQPSKLHENAMEQGIARFNLVFSEAGSDDSPSSRIDQTASLLSSADSAVDTINSGFEKVFDVTKGPGFLADEAIKQVEGLQDLMDKVTKPIKAEALAIADFSFKLRNLRGAIRTLINTPALLAKQLSDALSRLSGLVPGGDRKDILGAYAAFFRYGDTFPVVPLTTGSRAIQAKNQEAVVRFTRQIAIAFAAKEAVSATFTSYNDAKAQRDVITSALEAELEATTDDDVFEALLDVQSGLVAAVPDPAQDLPELVTITPRTSVPSVVLLYKLYGSLDLESDLIARNNISHPGLIAGGRPLEVLRNG